MSNVEQRVRDLIIQTMRLDAQNLPSELNVDSINTWDSLCHLELIGELERQFKVEIPHSESILMLSENSILKTLKKLL